MPKVSNPPFSLTSAEKLIVKTFARGTQAHPASNEGSGDAIWTPEATEALNSVLKSEDNKVSLSSTSTQHLLCALTEILELEKNANSEPDISKVLVKLMHFVVETNNWVPEEAKIKKSRKHQVTVDSTPPVAVAQAA